MKGTGFTKEHGQVLVILAIIMIGLMAMLALGLDMGNVLTKRRAAQNAADAGALAGADVWCATQDSGAAWSAANTYATSYNEANTADIFIPSSPDTGLITVTAHIPVDTYFAGVAFDAFDVITATATASAGCYSACYAEHVLPVAWNCRPTVEDTPVDPDADYECQQEVIDLDTWRDYSLESPPLYHPELYIIMDNISYANATCDPLNDPGCTVGGDFYCKEDYPDYGELTCDIDQDGKVDWIGSGGRSWIDLDGSGPGNPNDCSAEPDGDPPNLTDSGGAELGYWIVNGYGCELFKHTWVPEVTGVSGDLFKDTEQRMFDYPWVTIPVFSDFCIGSPDVPDGTCATPADRVHPQDQFRLDPATSPTYFHIIDFSYFYITCVTRNTGDNCPGVAKLKAINPDFNLNNMKAVEGYFVEAFDPDLVGRCDGIGTGAYQIYLAK